MPAIIRVLAGPGSGREHWIDSPVMRIGSHPDCELCIPSPQLPPHACTLEFRNRQYALLNRSQQSFQLADRTVEKQSKDIWAHGEQLELLGVAALTLYLDRDPTPCPKPASRASNEPSVAPVEEESSTANEAVDQTVEAPKSGFSSKEMIQLAITIACCLGMVAILAFKFFPAKISEPEKATVTLAEVLEDRKDSVAANDKVYQSLVSDLQEAGIMRSKGNLRDAVSKLTMIRDTLHQRRNSQGKFDNAYDDRLYLYVASMLEKTKPPQD